MHQLKKQLLIGMLAVAGIFTAIKVVETSSTAKQTGPGYIWIEAESGSITSPMQVGTDAAASGGSYIAVAVGNNSNSSPPTTGVATYNFNVTAAGTHKVWARVIAPTTSDDSFWMRMDGGAWIRWNEVSLGSSWHWDDLRNSDAGNAVVTFNLSAGSHTFQVGYREDGTLLDRLLITNDLTFIPTGTGPSMCVTATAGSAWQNTPFSSQTGTFTAEFDVTPSAAPINGMVGLSQGPETGWTGFAVIVAFDTTNHFVARNGGAYQAATVIPYSANVSYHVRLEVNVPAHTYSAFLRPPGGSEQTLASNYAFRTEQASVTSLDSWGAGLNATPAGSLTACGFTLNPTLPPGGCLRTVSVNSNSTLGAALSNALPGDCIVLANGNYAGFTINRDGTAANPITIRAANRGLANITSGIIRFNQTSYVTVEGLNITTAGGSQTIDGSTQKVAVWFDGADNCRLTRSVLRLSGHTSATHFVMLGGNSQFNRIDHCEFGPNSVTGCHLIWPRGNPTITGVTPNPTVDRGPWANGQGPFNPNMARNTRIDHNYFHDHLPTTTNGGETIVLGGVGITGDYQDTFSVVEFNLWENCFGDGELISIKTSSSTIRYNTVLSSGGGFTSRAGNKSQIYGNFILQNGRTGSGAIRIHEMDHSVYNNYIEGTSGQPIIVGYGDPYDSAAFSHAQVVRAKIVHNTLVDCGGDVHVGTAHPLLPVDLVIANNLLLNTNFSGPSPLSGWAYSQNIIWPNNPGQPGFLVVNPLLTLVSGVQKLSSSSPAINAANGSFYPFVTDDMDGQTRAGSRDIGSDELSVATILRRPLTTADVGTNAP
jgi:poly(beta-D-mannuronate) lyase